MSEGVAIDIRRVARAAADSPDLTHDGLALALGREWADHARYVAAWGRWMFYDPEAGIWRADETLRHMTLAREYLRSVADSLEDDGPAKRLRQADTVAKVVGLARSNPAQVATVDQWDADDWLLGTPSGVVDLRTGELRPARPDDYLTLTTAVAPAPAGTPAPRWAAFQNRICDGDADLIGYKQRLYGYALTGSIREHVFAFGHGTGANGKSVEVNTSTGILGDYATTIPVEMLMVSQTERHPTELARLRGVRLAVGSETEQGKRWAESRIKALTGGDPIAARFMRQDFFEFTPRFKLFVVGNHRPSLRGVDEAMRRRLHLIPYTVTIPEPERDHELPEKLREEWPAILRWMIDGCLAWQRGGLMPPQRVKEATQHYLDAEDAIQLWMDECTETAPERWEAVGSLYASWQRWAERAGEVAGSQKRFANVLEERGFQKQRQGGTGLRGYRGLRLLDG